MTHASSGVCQHLLEGCRNVYGIIKHMLLLLVPCRGVDGLCTQHLARHFRGSLMSKAEMSRGNFATYCSHTCHLHSSFPSVSSFTAMQSAPPGEIPLQFPDEYPAKTTESSSLSTIALERQSTVSVPSCPYSAAVMESDRQHQQVNVGTSRHYYNWNAVDDLTSFPRRLCEVICT